MADRPKKFPDDGAKEGAAPAANRGLGGRAKPAPAKASSKATPSAEVKGEDFPRRIIDWLMHDVRDQRGVHWESVLTVIGALAGFAAQNSIWEGLVKTGVLPEDKAFMVLATKSGETFYFGDAINMTVVAVDANYASVWKIVAAGAVAAGAERVPDIRELVEHCANTVGTDKFGIPRLPREHTPRLLPRQALDRYWRFVPPLLKGCSADAWHLQFAVAAQRLMPQVKGICKPEFAAKIVMEAAVPMSKIDPKTVPTAATAGDRPTRR